MVIRHDVNPENYIVDEADYPAIFPVFEDGGIKECVATLIAEQWAVTAAHCLDLLFQQDYERRPYHVKIAGKKNVVVEAVWPESWGSFEVIRDDDGQLVDIFLSDVSDRSRDIALLKLRDTVTHIDPIPLYDGNDEVDQTIILLGWGDFGTGDVGLTFGEPINDGKFRIATNIITATYGNTLFFEFDSPESGNALPLEGVNGPGDSGGPALVETDNGFQIIGVSSGGQYYTLEQTFSPQGLYGWYEYYVRISTMRSWIEGVLHHNRIGAD